MPDDVAFENVANDMPERSQAGVCFGQEAMQCGSRISTIGTAVELGVGCAVRNHTTKDERGAAAWQEIGRNGRSR